MKNPGFLAASVAAASVTALSATSSPSFVCNSNFQISHQEDINKGEQQNSNSSMQRSPSTDKFAPRFDGLRFIETLITAHR
ncbi:uncharacterized protein LOC125422215 [Ziziphus jujuba]|uniref:Uncharacterized protein LOC125422215 n=1 Tax=Ziziphus jujuba TaxID=326968 RepID=A0ABM3II28_ZIZJJ|nr:uncharacterized protein LOC125422215 [Ziziphus jujuba]